MLAGPMSGQYVAGGFSKMVWIISVSVSALAATERSGWVGVAPNIKSVSSMERPAISVDLKSASGI